MLGDVHLEYSMNKMQTAAKFRRLRKAGGCVRANIHFRY